MVLFTSENSDIANHRVDTSFFTSEKDRITKQLASRARKDYFSLDAFWRVNLGMYIINIYMYMYIHTANKGTQLKVLNAGQSG